MDSAIAKPSDTSQAPRSTPLGHVMLWTILPLEHGPLMATQDHTPPPPTTVPAAAQLPSLLLFLVSPQALAFTQVS